MRSHRFKLFAPLLVSLVFGLFSQTTLAAVNDPAIGREQAVNKMNEADFNQQSLRFKIISSRTLILYIQDILPNKGNPYFHMADFGAQSTKESFNKVQENNQPYMDDFKNPIWFPKNEKQRDLTSTDLKNTQIESVVEYFAQFVATAEVMKTLIQPILSQSIIVDSIEVSVGPETKLKFDKAWQHIDFLSQKYKDLLNQSKSTQTYINRARRKAILLISGAIAKGMQRHLSVVVKPNNQKELSQYLQNIEDISSESAEDTNKQNIKNKVSKLHNKESPLFKVASKTFESVDLPDSGDIDGADQAFEVAMRLEVGFDLLKNLFSEISHW